MAIEFPSLIDVDYTVSQVINSGSNSSITGAKPTGVMVGDLIEFSLKMYNSANPLVVTAPEIEWLTLISNNYSGSGAGRLFTGIYYIAVKNAGILAALPDQFTFSFTPEAIADDRLVIRRITGVDLDNPIGAISAFTNANTSSPVGASITTTAQNSVVMCHVGTRNGSVFIGEGVHPDGTTLLLSARTRSFSSGLTDGSAYMRVDEPSAIGVTTWLNFLSASAAGSTINYELIEKVYDPQYIDTVGGGTDTVKIGSATQFTAVGFSPNVSSGTLDGVTIAVSSSSITTPSFADEQQMPMAGDNRVLTLGNGSQSASKSTILVTPPDGWDYVAIESGFNEGEANSIAFEFDPPLSVGDVIYFNPSHGSVDSSAGYSGSYSGYQTMWHHEALTRVVRGFLLITGSDSANLPTEDDIDDAIPIGGIPNRLKTNVVLKRIVNSVSDTPSSGSIVIRDHLGKIKASNGSDPDDLITLDQLQQAMLNSSQRSKILRMLRRVQIMPESMSSTGRVGDVYADQEKMRVCIADNNWRELILMEI